MLPAVELRNPKARRSLSFTCRASASIIRLIGHREHSHSIDGTDVTRPFSSYTTTLQGNKRPRLMSR
jgi:hypothetical protein